MIDSALPAVYVVDDDAALRDSLRWLLESAGHRVAACAGAAAVLATHTAGQGGFLFLDTRVPGWRGRKLGGERARRGLAPLFFFPPGPGDAPRAGNAPFFTAF